MEYVKDGTVTYYDLWPEKSVKITELSKNVNPNYNIRKYKIEDLLFKDVSKSEKNGMVSQFGEGRPSDLLLRIATEMSIDKNVKQTLNDIQNSGKKYNASSFNCSTFSQEAIKVIFPNFNASQVVDPSGILSVMFKSSIVVAPNNLYNEAACKPGVSIWKGTEQIMCKPYLEYFSK